MEDREKVIKGLECCTGLGCHHGCEYLNSGCTELLKKDAIALLKEQEAVEPTLIREGRNKYYNDYVCPCCDNELHYGQNYCSECGKAMKWK